LLVVLSRIMLTHHYLSDVMAASYIALFEIALLLYWLHKKSFFSDVLKGS
jgi:membrane-associated phospholipid phosphatase